MVRLKDIERAPASHYTYHYYCYGESFSERKKKYIFKTSCGASLIILLYSNYDSQIDESFWAMFQIRCKVLYTLLDLLEFYIRISLYLFLNSKTGIIGKFSTIRSDFWVSIHVNYFGSALVHWFSINVDSVMILFYDFIFISAMQLSLRIKSA